MFASEKALHSIGPKLRANNEAITHFEHGEEERRGDGQVDAR
jgi:hypothetical protein